MKKKININGFGSIVQYIEESVYIKDIQIFMRKKLSKTLWKKGIIEEVSLVKKTCILEWKVR